MSIKIYRRIIVVIIGSFFLYIAFIFIHELGHMLALYLCGYDEMELVFDFPWMGVKHDYIKDIHQKRFVIIAGSGLAISIAFIVYIYGYKKRNNILYWNSFLSIIHNIGYWVWSIIEKKGDGWDFIQTYNHFNPYWIIIPLSVIYLVFSVLTGRKWVDRFYEYYVLEKYRSIIKEVDKIERI